MRQWKVFGNESEWVCVFHFNSFYFVLFCFVLFCFVCFIQLINFVSKKKRRVRSGQVKPHFFDFLKKETMKKEAHFWKTKSSKCSKNCKRACAFFFFIFLWLSKQVMLTRENTSLFSSTALHLFCLLCFQDYFLIFISSIFVHFSS